MQKRTKTRDYNNYDYLDATVKKHSMEQLIAHYKVLGWEYLDGRDDKIYYDIKHIVLRRPHAIAYKDELQLLQVYLESAWNRIGKAEANPCPRTLFAGLFFGIISLAAIILGLLGGLGIFKYITSLQGYFLCGAGVALAVINAAICLKYRKYELNKTAQEVETAVHEIKSVYNSAAALTKGDSFCQSGETAAGGEE